MPAQARVPISFGLGEAAEPAWLPGPLPLAPKPLRNPSTVQQVQSSKYSSSREHGIQSLPSRDLNPRGEVGAAVENWPGSRPSQSGPEGSACIQTPPQILPKKGEKNQPISQMGAEVRRKLTPSILGRSSLALGSGAPALGDCAHCYATSPVRSVLMAPACKDQACPVSSPLQSRSEAMQRHEQGKACSQSTQATRATGGALGGGRHRHRPAGAGGGHLPNPPRCPSLRVHSKSPRLRGPRADLALQLVGGHEMGSCGSCPGPEPPTGPRLAALPTHG